MSLKNPSDKKVAFKIKTTAPKRYCVRPNCGELASKEKAEISGMSNIFDLKICINLHQVMILFRILKIIVVCLI